MSVDPVWLKIHAERDWGKWPSEILVREVANLKLPHSARVLDLGCGQGANTRFLAEWFENVTALDASPDALHKAHGLIASQREYRQVIWVLEELPAALGGPYDLIVDHFTTCQIPGNGLVRTLIDCWEALAPGGVFISFSYSHVANLVGVGHCTPTSVMDQAYALSGMPSVYAKKDSEHFTVDYGRGRTGQVYIARKQPWTTSSDSASSPSQPPPSS